MTFAQNVKISSALPDTERLNGLGALHDRAVIAPHAEIYAVVRFRVDKITRDIRSGEQVVLLRIWHVEAVEGDAAAEARDLAQGALEDRLGITQLPTIFDDIEDDEPAGAVP
jgi:hypothetical protein